MWQVLLTKYSLPLPLTYAHKMASFTASSEIFTSFSLVVCSSTTFYFIFFFLKRGGSSIEGD